MPEITDVPESISFPDPEEGLDELRAVLRDEPARTNEVLSAVLDEQPARVDELVAVVDAEPRRLAELVATLDSASDEHAAAMRPENTARGYAGDWKAWERFTAEAGLPADSATRGTLRAFVLWLWEAGAATSTIDRRLTGVTVTLRRDRQVDVDPEAVRLARELLKDHVRQAAAQRQPERGRGQAAPLLLPDLRAMSASCGTDLAGIRDRALILLAFAVAGRRSELAGLGDTDVVDDANGLLVHLRVSKTKPRTVAVPYGSNPMTCPVRAWKAWQAAKHAAGVDEAGAAFLRIDRHGRIIGPMTGQAVGNVITRVAERAGVEARLTGHSARAGLATEARRAGKDRKAIADVTGHAPGSPVLDRYIRSVDQWDSDENALIGIGL